LRVEQLESRDLLSTLPAGFQEDLVAGGLYEPTSMAVAPDGRIFVTEKPYGVRVIQDGQLLSTPFVSLTVERSGERGVQSVVFDPSFTQNRYVYVYYTHRTASGSFDRLSRFTASSANPNVAEAGSELVLLDGIPTMEPGFHNGGVMQFGADGMLYLGIGDTGDTALPQDLSKLQGKILRLNLATYPNLLPSDNPYVNTPGARGEIWALGFRNPFTGDMVPGTSRLLVGDVGGDNWEEIDEVLRGANYGWPLAEGMSTNPNFTNPLYTYEHDNNQGAAIVGGEFYTGANFPASYNGKYFFADYVRGFLKTFDLTTRAVESFGDEVLIPVDVANAPDGSLYWLSLGFGSDTNGALYQIRYVGTNRAPLAVAAANPTNGSTPLTVAFDGTASSDPDGDTLVSYAWNFGDGQTGTGATVAHEYAVAGTYSAVLTVSDGQTTGQSQPITISVGNTAPTPTITLPELDATYRAGDTINFSGSATDPQEGPLAASALEWAVVFHHNQHTHPFLVFPGVASGSFQIPLTGEIAPDQWYRITLTATDSGGLKQSVSRDVIPVTSTFTLASNLAGASLLLDGQPTPAGTTIEGVVNMTRTIEAPATQLVGGRMYKFVSWSDGGTARHDIATPLSPTTFTAQYQAMALAATYAGTPPAGTLPGKTVSFPLTITNVGSETWLSSGTTKVRLGVYLNGRSDLPNDWPTQPVRFSLPRNVAPGQSVTINVSLKAPTTPGNYVLRARMVKENVAWFEPLFKSDFQVQTLAASYAGNVPTVWSTKQTQSYQITVTNTGTATWNAGGTDKVRLAVWFGGSSDKPPTGSSQPMRVALPRDILPGESVTLSVSIAAPSSAGNYTLRHRMIKETVGYFSEMLRTAVSVEVFSARITGSQPTTWLNNESKTYSLTIKNQGSKTWNATGNYPVRLGVYFGGTSDAMPYYPVEPQRFDLPRDVAPGQSLTMTVNVVAPNTGGNYVLRARMVKELVAWGNEMLKTNVVVQTLAASYAAAVPTNWNAGETKSYSLTVTNTGTAAWDLTGTNPVHLGVYFGGANPAPGSGADEPIRFNLAPGNVTSIAPGQSATLTVTITAPLTPGQYTLRHRLVKEHVNWFNEFLATTVTVS
jgi:glucose/arabinose dehydrogenase